MKRTDSCVPVAAADGRGRARGPRRAGATLIVATILFCLLLGLPLAGAICAKVPLAHLAEFPPRTRFFMPAPFAWPVFVFLALLILILVLPLAWRVIHAQHTMHTPAKCVFPFPTWGWLALVLGGGAWVLAWTRLDWFQPLQSFTFSPLWIAYIGVVNALTFRRTGHCLLMDRPGRLLILTLASAVFWWYFEYLNRFSQNWYYAGLGDFTSAEYVLFATLPFATVLPAFVSTEELLATFPRLTAGLTSFRPVGLTHVTGVCLFAAGAVSLFALPCFPNTFFPLVWIAPALILAGQAIGRGRPCVLSDLETGNGSRLVRVALAALLCGFFWEMWNYGSLAQWKYAVPYVNRFHIFEMPLLGYAGYLPFGIECALVADALMGRPVAPGRPGPRA